MRYLQSAVGRKQLMGLTGLAWALFVLTHMAGNLLILVGSDAYNKYSHALVSNPFLIVAEAGLVLTFLIHVYYGITLTIENKRARQSKYAMPTNGEKAARPNSKFMIYHGTLVLAFLILHIAKFKYGTYYETTVDGVVMRDLHRLVIEVFQSPGYVAWYLFALVCVGLHLSHGFYSSFCSLGFYHPRYSLWLNRLGYVYAAVVTLGFIVQPLYVFLNAR
jgi:succinate dehydrogenase / fumarate reductase cytochrome b subunit